MFFAIIVIIIAADQFTKYLISSAYAVGQSVPIYKDLLYFTSVRNTGAAYNILQDHTRILTYIVAGILAVILLYVLISWKGLSKTTRFAFAMILGGGLGNLIDRYFLGYVVDFIDIKVIPVFNVADIMICIGCGLLVIDVLIIEPIQSGIKKRKEKKAKKLAEKAQKEQTQAAAPAAPAAEPAKAAAPAAPAVEPAKPSETVTPAAEPESSAAAPPETVKAASAAAETPEAMDLDARVKAIESKYNDAWS